VGLGRGLFLDDPRTHRRRTKREVNFDAMLEKIAYDLYQEMGRGIFQVPKNYLSLQIILDPFTAIRQLDYLHSTSRQNYYTLLQILKLIDSLRNCDSRCHF
jgi:hypothetical protein